MSDYGLDDFVLDCRHVVDDADAPADCVASVAPLMRRLVAAGLDFLRPEHLRDDPAHYARNGIHVPDDGKLSLYALVWRPGQWTPVHDHGTWGVIGVVQGVLQERNFVRTDDGDGDEDITLARGGLVMLTPGSVSSFVPNPDHIHVTGVPADGVRAVSLHLYGRELSDFHVYDLAAGRRRRVTVAYNES